MRTGIAGLDEKLAGGLPPGSLVLLLSNSETALKVFFHQILHSLACEKHHVFYLTVTKDPDYVREEMRLYNWKIDEFEQQKQWNFIDGYAYKANLLLGHKPINREPPTDPLVSIRTEILSLLTEGGVVAVDSLSDLLVKYDSKDIMELLEIVLITIRQQSALGVLPVINALHDKTTIATVAHLADIVIDLILDEAQFAGKMRFLKIRNARVEPFALPFTLTHQGVVAETFSRIY